MGKRSQIHQAIGKPGSCREQRQRNPDLYHPSVSAQKRPAADFLTEPPTSERNPKHQCSECPLTRDSPQVPLVQTALKQPKGASRRRLAPRISRSVWLLGHNCHLNASCTTRPLVTCLSFRYSQKTSDQ